MPSPIWKLRQLLLKKKSEFLKRLKKSSAFYPVKRAVVSIIFYRRTWAKSGAKKQLEEFAKSLLLKYNEFNLLNFSAKILSRAAEKLGLKRLSSFLATSMQEDTGINRHVIFRYLMKELFLYFFIAFLWSLLSRLRSQLWSDF